jgi:hypothetical protein
VLSNTSRDILNELKGYFSKTNIIHDIRNKYAFHYDRQRVQEEIQSVPQDAMQMMFVAEHSGNCLFAFADTMINSSLLNAIDSANPSQAVDVLIEEIAVKVCRWFQDFGHGCVEVLCKQLGEKSTTDGEIQNVPINDDVGLPYFVQR